MWDTQKEEYFNDDSTDVKRWIMDHAYTEQPFLVAIKGKMNSIGHCIGIVQNMIIDATLLNGIELSHDTLDAVLGETVTEIIWCRTFYPTSDKVRSSLSIRTSVTIQYHIIQFNARFYLKIVLENKCWDHL